MKIIVHSSWEGIDKRRCSRCKKWKTIVPPRQMVRGRLKTNPNSDFSWHIEYRRRGFVVVCPLTKCRACKAEQVKASRDRKKDEMGREAFLDAQRAYRNQRRQDPAILEMERSYARHWWRENHGQGLKVWGKYENEIGGRLPLVPTGPFIAWYSNLNGRRPTDEMLGERLIRAVRRALSGEVQNIHLDIVDEVGVIVGETHLIHFLYPEV